MIFLKSDLHIFTTKKMEELSEGSPIKHLKKREYLRHYVLIRKGYIKGTVVKRASLLHGGSFDIRPFKNKSCR